ncbi:MAG: FAD-binding protein, partial [Lachnospiraceae bacterium]|nr:FAD-binding protein [Lachnospiraceae bacterium]
AQKKMLVSEAVRGEGGRLFYLENGKRVYFMEEKYGPRGNLMTRDVVSREIEATGKDVFLDISFLGAKEIGRRIPEVRDLCRKYRGIDITREPIPVSPSVHFFMGGIAVRLNHETNIENLFAVGECAAIYHGANRLGGNSLLAALYGGRVAASVIAERPSPAGKRPDFTALTDAENEKLRNLRASRSPFPVMYIRDMAAETMNRELGIVRDEESLMRGLTDMDYYLSIAERIAYDSSVMMYANYSLTGILTLARATLTSALARRESRGSHFRKDYPAANESMAYGSVISFDNGKYRVWLDREKFYES